MGISSDDRFLRLARRALKELFPKLPQQPGFHKRRAKLTETIEWLIGVRSSPTRSLINYTA